MILNERQYGITKTKVREFEQAIAKLRNSPEPETINDRLRLKAHLDTLNSQLEEFKDENNKYASASFTKLLRIQKALNLEIKEELIFK